MASSDHQVLVIEDDRDIRESIVELLEDAGYAAAGFAHGALALAELRRREAAPPCLILLDLMMPVMDGRAFREEQANDPVLAEVPVLVLSAGKDTDAVAGAMGVAGFLKKPIQVSDLLATVRRHCPDPLTPREV